MAHLARTLAKADDLGDLAWRRTDESPPSVRKRNGASWLQKACRPWDAAYLVVRAVRGNKRGVQ